MNTIIVDDEEMARAIIRRFAANNPQIDVVAEFPSAIEAIKYLNQNKVDLIFLDIHMPNFSGFDFIQAVKNPPNVILITSDKNFAVQAFEYEFIVDYLVKPLTQDRFDKAMQKAINFKNVQLTEQNEKKRSETEKANDLYININRRLIKIDIPTICLIEAKGDYILIKTDKNNYTVHSTLKKIEDKLPDHLFLKVHRSFIINTKKIIDIEDGSVLIKKDVVPVSRSNKPELMRRLNLL